MFAVNIDRLKALLGAVIADLPEPTGCACATWADGLALTYEMPGTVHSEP
jgi:5'-methylthioadenosine phosphorylase